MTNVMKLGEYILMTNKITKRCTNANCFELGKDNAIILVDKLRRGAHDAFVVGLRCGYKSSHNTHSLSGGVLVPQGGWISINGGAKYICDHRGILRLPSISAGILKKRIVA